MTNEPSANGATFYVELLAEFGRGSCYAEFDMTGDDDSPYWQTCYFHGKTINYHLTTLNLQQKKQYFQRTAKQYRIILFRYRR